MQTLYRNQELVPDAESYHLNHIGYGVFETFLLKLDEFGKYKVPGLDLHFKRLKAGCEMLDLPFLGERKYTALLEEGIKNYTPESGLSLRVRIIVYEKDWFLQLEPFSQENTSIKLKSVTAERLLPEIKSCSALACSYSQKLAKKDGYDEALLLDRDGVIREASWGNFFWLDKDGVIHTAAEKVLLGVTRELVLDIASKSHDIKFGNFKYDLDKIEAAFTCRSTLGITEVSLLDTKQLKPAHPAITALDHAYQSLYLEQAAEEHLLP